MAKNRVRGDERSVGAVKGRSQSKSAAASVLTQRNDKTGRFVEVKPDPKSTKVIKRTAERFADAMKRLAKR